MVKIETLSCDIMLPELLQPRRSAQGTHEEAEVKVSFHVSRGSGLLSACMLFTSNVFTLLKKTGAKCKKKTIYPIKGIHKPYLCQGMGCHCQQPSVHEFRRPSTFFIITPVSLKIFKEIE